MMDIIQRPSLNFDDRPAGEQGGRIDMIVLHYTGMKTGAQALKRLRDKQSKVSAHYFVDLKGQIFQLVAEEKRAWHAGVSHWAGHDNVNDRSIGIEIVNRGHWFGYRPFPKPQMAGVTALVADIARRHAIHKNNVVGHSDVAPTRKEDPGERFGWTILAQAGLAHGPYEGPAEDEENLPDYEQCFLWLRQIGYQITVPDHAAVVLAFQRRFCPKSLGRGLDPLTRTAIKHVRALVINS